MVSCTLLKSPREGYASCPLYEPEYWFEHILKEGLSKISSDKKQEVKKLLDKKLKEIYDSVDNLVELKADIRDSRKASSAPKSEEEAKKLRKNKKWQLADAAFKMIAKYGYLQLISDLEQVKDSKSKFLDKDVKSLQKIIIK